MAGFDKSNIKCLHGSTPSPFNWKCQSFGLYCYHSPSPWLIFPKHKSQECSLELRSGTLLSGKFCSSTVGVRSSSSSSQPELGIGWGTTANKSVQGISETFAMPLILEFFGCSYLKRALYQLSYVLVLNILSVQSSVDILCKSKQIRENWAKSSRLHLASSWCSFSNNVLCLLNKLVCRSIFTKSYQHFL